MCTSCVLGEPEIWHQHPVLENRWSPDGDQRGEACFAEKCSNRRSVQHISTSFPTVINDTSKHLLNRYFSHHSLSFITFYQVSPTHQSVSHVSRGRSAEPRAPPHVTPVLGTPTLATERAPAPPVTRPLSMQVGRNTHTEKDVHILNRKYVESLQRHDETAVQYSVKPNCL